MNTDRKIALGVLVVAVFAAMIGCKKTGPPTQFAPPDGVYPPRVGKLSVEEGRDLPACIQAEKVQCLAFYVEPGGDPDVTRIYHLVDIYDSPEDATERLEAYSRERMMDEDTTAWEDRLDKEGKNVGRLLIKYGFRFDGEGMIGSCSVSYTKDAMFISISSGIACEPAREFLKDLTAITN